MKRTLILLLTIMATRIFAFSSDTLTTIEPDSIVYVTSQDIKYANLIFVEHKRLRSDKALLLEQLENYKGLNYNLQRVDSIRTLQVSEYEKLNSNYLQQIDNLNKDLKRKNRTILCWKIGGITVTTGLLLFLLLK